MTIKILRDNNDPVRIHETFQAQLYQDVRLPLKSRIHDSSKGKIGRLKLASRLSDLDNLEWKKTLN